MIVAADAAERHAHERRANLADLRVDVVGLHPRLVGIHDLNVAEHEKAGGDDFLRAILLGVRRHEVAGDLLADELVEGLVRIERGDHVVAITPRVLGEGVVRGADHIGVAGEIEPVPGPAFAKSTRTQQPIHDFFAGVRRAIVFKRGDVCQRRWQPGQVETDAAQPGRVVRVGHGAHGGCFQFCEDEAIKRIERPRPVRHARRCGIGHGLKRPEFFPFGEVDRPALRRDRAGPRIDGALLHPLLENRDFPGGQLLLGRHLQIFIRVAHGLDQQALFDVTGQDDWPAVAAGLPSGPRIESEPAFDFLLVGVAFETPLREQWEHLRFEKNRVRGRTQAEGCDCVREEEGD